MRFEHFGKNANNIVQKNARCIKLSFLSKNEMVYLCEFIVNKFNKTMENLISIYEINE